MEDICQLYRDNKLPSYSQRDFTLSDGIRKVSSEAWKYTYKYQKNNYNSRTVGILIRTERYFSVTGVKTLIESGEVGTRNSLENILITHNEKAEIVQDEATKISYDRLNHVPFSYEISIINPRKVKKNVIVRLWLGLSSDDEDMR